MRSEQTNDLPSFGSKIDSTQLNEFLKSFNSTGNEIDFTNDDDGEGEGEGEGESAHHQLLSTARPRRTSRRTQPVSSVCGFMFPFSMIAHKNKKES